MRLHHTEPVPPERVESEMYDRILVAIDLSPDSPDEYLQRTIQFAKMTRGAVHLLHVARGHVVAYDITAGSGLGVLDSEDDIHAGEKKVVQDAVDRLAAAGIPVHGELVNATEHDIADIILQRAKDLRADLIVLGPSTTGGPGSLSTSYGGIRPAPSCSPDQSTNSPNT